MMDSVKGLIYISKYLAITIIRNRRFPMPWLKWRVETYYGITTDEFTFRRLFKVAKLSDLLKYAKWVQENRKMLSGDCL